MKLATRDNGTRDGELILVNRAMTISFLQPRLPQPCNPL